MSTAAPADRPSGATRRRVPAKLVLWGLLALVLAAMAIDTTFRSTDAPPITAGGREAFDRPPSAARPSRRRWSRRSRRTRRRSPS